MTNILTEEQVTGYARDAGFHGSALSTAVAVAHAESSFDADNIGDRDLTERGERSVGLWQINYRPSRDRGDAVRDPKANLDPATNARHAYQISGGGNNFKPWSTYTSGAYRKFLDSARDSSASADSAKASGSSTGTRSWGDIGFDRGRAQQIRIGGELAVQELGYSLLNGSVSLTSQEASQLTARFDDVDYRLLSTKFLRAGPPDGTLVEVAGLRWRVMTLGTVEAERGPALEITCQPSGVVRMRGFSPPNESNVSPTDYMHRVANIAGLKFRGQSSAVKGSVGPKRVADQVSGAKRPENSWELGQRLAQELGFVCYETAGTLCFGMPAYLAKIAPVWQLAVAGSKVDEPWAGPPYDCWGWPDVSTTALIPPGVAYDPNLEQPLARTLSAKLGPDDGLRVAAGDEVWLFGVPVLGGNDSLTVTTVNYDLGDSVNPISFSAAEHAILAGKALTQVIQAHPVKTADTPSRSSVNLEDSRDAEARGWGSPPVSTAVIVSARGGGVTLPVNEGIAPLIRYALKQTKTRGYHLHQSECWGYAPRHILHDSSKPWSNHAWGLAVDLNATHNPYGGTAHDFPTDIVRKVWNPLGFRWGGDYHSTKDWMHFEFMGTPDDAASIIAANNLT